ncbi:hypothetical protein NQ314_003252 [Rhamnusium bicolor]|uniref:Uncharacterized protein n=1 Tax=Rhamnusium bicolor TaxID=1586634 RepID=A0AAV8ZQX4_9CUCU|nr:hypothetical protein NQ314_003252 [Rhamnusium bicolor]
MSLPADVSVFKPLKASWKRAVRERQSRPGNLNRVLTKLNFCSILADVLNNAKLPEYIKNGFRKCGIDPFNLNTIDFTKCVQNKLENHKRE